VKRQTIKGETINNCLIVCNGEFSKKLFNKFDRLNSPAKQFTVIACDGAANTLKKYSAAPDIITGDFDSISPKVLSYYKNKKVIVKKVFDQDKTDLEKAIGLALKTHHKNITVIGYAGGRTDHTLNNFSVLKKNCGKCSMKFVDDEFEIFFAGKTTEFDYKKGEVVSLLAMPKAERIKTTGLKWQLKNETLEFGKREGALNMSSANHVKIETGKGSLLIFKKHFGKFI
jgi:thiamine pyrophosphokinase